MIFRILLISKRAGYVCVVQCKNVKKFSLTQMVNEILQDKELIAGLGLWVGNLKAISQAIAVQKSVGILFLIQRLKCSN